MPEKLHHLYDVVHELVSFRFLIELVGVSVAALVQPSLSIYCYTFSPERAEMLFLGNRFQQREETVDAHDHNWRVIIIRIDKNIESWCSEINRR